MQGIDERQLLLRLMDRCKECRKVFEENISTIVDEADDLDDQQVEAVLVHLTDLHRKHEGDDV